MSSDGYAIDVGAGLGLGGAYTAVPNYAIFAEIAGTKENATSGNYAGKLLLKTRVNGGGLNTGFVMDAGGRVTLPLQPKFLAVNSATDAGISATPTDIVCDTEVYDIGANYNNATGIFTAPVAGYYAILAQVDLLKTYAGAGEVVTVTLVTSTGADYAAQAIATVNGTPSIGFSIILSLAASETVKMSITAIAPSGTVSVIGGAPYTTWFSAQLIG